MHRTDLTRAVTVVAGLAAVLASGCAALTNPVADGIPARRLSPEALGESRSSIQPVPLTALVPPQPDAYKLAPGDVLGIFIEGILGERGEKAIPPVRIPEQANVPPAIGFPIPVRENGTLPLPLIDPLDVNGLTLEQTEQQIRTAYSKTKEIIKKIEDARIIVTLLRPRQYHVLVLREDAGGTTFGSSGGFNSLGGGTGSFFSQTRRAAGFPLDLPAYENDLLNALSRSGGLPGPEAEDEVLITRGAYRPGVGGGPGALAPDAATRQTIRVPLRLRPGEPPTVRPEDLVLRTGDVVHVKARVGELFFTGGLLPPRAFPLPPDRDLDVLEAIALVGGPIVNGGVNANNLSGQIVQTGLGFPSPSQVTIVRRLKSGAQIPIIVSVNRAMKDPRERIAIRPGDFVILQQTAGEGLGQYITSNFRLNFLGFFAHQQDATGTATFTAP
jgi:protein involved in polysaccharide export with SLBB domain